MKLIIHHHIGANRPPFRRKLDSINVTAFILLIIPTITIVTIAPLVHNSHALITKNKTRQTWTSVALGGGPIDNIVADEQDGSVFATVDGDIFKYTNNLEFLLRTPPGKQNPSSQLGNSAFNAPQQFAGITNKVLVALKENRTSSRGSSPRDAVLLSCLQNKNLILNCMFFRKSDLLMLPIPWTVEGKNILFKTDVNEHIQVLFDKHDTKSVLLVTNRLTASENQLLHVVNSSTSLPNENFQDLHLPAMGRFQLNKTANSLTRLEMISVLPYGTRIDEYNVLYNYVHMFHYQDYTLFVLNDIRKSTDPNAKPNSKSTARFARICNNDPYLDSYTEISLSCNGQFNLYAKSAYLDIARSDGPTLFVIFEITHEDSPTLSFNRRPAKSLLCAYSMKYIQDQFHRAISDCHSGKPASLMLAKLHSISSRVPICQINPSPESLWCTSKTNPYIDGYSFSYNVKESSYIELDGLTAINFIYTTQRQNSDDEFYFIGTDSGLLTKLNQKQDFYYTIDLFNHRVKYYQLEGEKYSDTFSNESYTQRHGTKYSVSSGNIFVATNVGELHKIPMDTCQFYDSCLTCINRDADCVWCGNSCSKSEDCGSLQQYNLTCPPYIDSFEPPYGPLTGATKLTIYGDNFGTPKGQLTIKIAEQDCLFDKNTISGERIQCYVKPVAQPLNATISIHVSDDSGYLYLNGSTSSTMPYMYLEPKVFGLSPAEGPANGGNELHIYGQNLHIGANRSVNIGERDCMITGVRNDRLICAIRLFGHTTISHDDGEYDEKSAADAPKEPFQVMIDGYLVNQTRREVYDGLSLSQTYQFRTDIKPPPTETTTTTDQSTSAPPTEDSYHVNRLIVALIIIASLSALFMYLARCDGFTRFKIKLPKALKSDPELGDAKVTFRNPQSQKFINSNPRPGESLNGLIKLNGSILSTDYFGKTEQLEQDKPLMNNFLDEEMMSILAKEKILIARNNLTLGHVLGSGQFGRVYKGFLKDEQTGEHRDVAVKTLHSRGDWDDTVDNRAFLDEGLMMKEFQHENVLALIGVTFDSNGLPMVITPFMRYGDLRSYISDESSSPTVKELIEFGTQVAQGMAYLSNLKFVHRDLAARNCMLDENLTVKVADFGLSRDIYERDYYSSDNKKAKLPVKWMAIESLEKSVYSTKTDVWSYGVLLWELMTRGVVPYPDVDNFDLFSYLKEGRRMLRPRYCPVVLYNIMLSCWNENPALRPTFSELVRSVSDVITRLQCAKEDSRELGEQEVSRDETYCDAIR